MLSQRDFIEILRTDDFALKTQQQIKKDFGMFGIHLFDETSITPSYDDLFFEVIDGLTKATEKGEQHLLRLLYQIDIPEKDFLSSISSDNFLEEMSKMIIQRESYKVYLRSKF